MITANPSYLDYPGSDCGRQDHSRQVREEQYPNRINYPNKKKINRKIPKDKIPTSTRICDTFQRRLPL